MKDIKISIIIPVYKVEKYIHQCVDSVVSQTYKNLEVILIDDESPDNCPKICNQYALMDNRVKVIHKKNGGASDARNAGIRAATGDYITFIDSDDYWDELQFLSILIQQIENSQIDVINFGYKKLQEDTGVIKTISFQGDRDRVNNVPKDIAFLYLMENGLYITSAWSKLIKRTLFTDHDLYFHEGITGEDIDWCARLAFYAKSFDITKGEYLIYRQRTDSTTKSISEKTINDIEKDIEFCIDFLPSDTSNIFREAYNSFISVQYANYLICLNNADKKYFEKHFQFAKQNKYLLNYGFTFRVKAIYIYSKIMGLKSAISFLGLVAKFM